MHSLLVMISQERNLSDPYISAKKRMNKKKHVFLKTMENEKNDNSKSSNISNFFASQGKSATISKVCRCCCPKKIDETIDDFNVFSGMCLFPEENQQPILGSHRFLKKSDIFIGRITKTHIFLLKVDENFSLRSAPLSIIFLLFEYLAIQ